MRILANNTSIQLALAVGGRVTASATGRYLAGEAVVYGVPGRTNRGRLKVRPGALIFPDDLTRVKLTREHVREASRGHLSTIVHKPTGIRVTAAVATGPEGDDAIREATDGTRDGFSFDIVDAQIVGDEIVSGVVVAIGQVGIPAYDDTRIDTVAASNTTPGESMTPEQAARLAALRAQPTRTAEEETELSTLAALETPPAATPAPPAAVPAAGTPIAVPAAGVPVAASMQAVPTGIPAPTRQAGEQGAGALQAFIQAVVGAVRPGTGGAEITAALTDVTHTQHSSIISPPAWSGELWSGLAKDLIWTPMLNSGPLTDWSGKGWRWVTKPLVGDYAGDKAAIPSGPLVTEPSEYQAARLAVGHDFDRKFYDFPDAGFLQSYMEACRESYAEQIDEKVAAYILASAVPVMNGLVPLTAPSLLKAVALAIRAVKRRKAGTASFVVVHDNDYDQLMDITEANKPAFLAAFLEIGVIQESADAEEGVVIAGAKQSATLRQLPGSPIRASAQHIANGGMDEAFFGYWAIETHHETAIASVEIA